MNNGGVRFLRQFTSLFQRDMELYLNDRKKVIVTMFLPVMIGLLILLVTDADKVGTYYESTKNMLFTIVSAAIYIGMFNSLTTICKERQILKREYMTGMSLSAYVLAQVVFQAILCAVQAEFFMLLFWGKDRVGFSAESALKDCPALLNHAYIQYFLTLFLIMLASDLIGLFVSSLVPNGEIANLIAPVIIIVQLVLAGVLFRLKGAMEKTAWLTVSKWGIELLGSVTNITGMDKLITRNDNWDKIADMAGGMADYSNHEKDVFQASFGHVAHHWGVLLLFVVVLAVLCILALRRVEKDKR